MRVTSPIRRLAAALTIAAVVVPSEGMASTLDDVRAAVDQAAALRGMRLAPDVPPLSSQHYERAAGGEVVTGLEVVAGHKAKKAYAVGIVGVPIDSFWRAINDDPRKVDYTKLGYAEVLSGGVCGTRRQVFQYLPVSLMTDRWWAFEVRANTGLHEASAGALREQYWTSDAATEPLTASAQAWADKGMSVVFTQGAWLLMALADGSTLVEYYSWADPGGAVPAGLASSFAAGSIKDTFASMTELARTGAACSG